MTMWQESAEDMFRASAEQVRVLTEAVESVRVAASRIDFSGIYEQLRWERFEAVEQRLDTLRWQAQDKGWSYEYLGREMARVFRDQGELVKEK